MKYRILVIWPIVSNGYSTGFAPIHVKTINEDLIDQNISLDFMFILLDNNILFLNGRIMITMIDIINAITPPSLFGIERKMAYANRKYHSGWMWIGVFNGFAGLKFSGSPIENGKISLKVIKITIKIMAPKLSFEKKNGWNDILSKFLFEPMEFFDPVSCRYTKWIINIIIIINGSRKCSMKNRFNVAFPTENPPQSHSTIFFPK